MLIVNSQENICAYKMSPYFSESFIVLFKDMFRMS